MDKSKLIIAVLLIVGILILSLQLNYSPTIKEPTPRNYEGEFNMGLIPNVPPRVPFEDDTLIGYVQVDDGAVIGLFESNHLETKDFKGIFAWRID